MLALAYRIVGRTFVIRTLFGVVVISLVFAVFQPMFTKPPVEGQTFMDVIIGAVLCGLGIGLVFIHNGSPAERISWLRWPRRRAMCP